MRWRNVPVELQLAGGARAKGKALRAEAAGRLVVVMLEQPLDVAPGLEVLPCSLVLVRPILLRRLEAADARD